MLVIYVHTVGSVLLTVREAYNPMLHNFAHHVSTMNNCKQQESSHLNDIVGNPLKGSPSTNPQHQNTLLLQLFSDYFLSLKSEYRYYALSKEVECSVRLHPKYLLTGTPGFNSIKDWKNVIPIIENDRLVIYSDSFRYPVCSFEDLEHHQSGKLKSFFRAVDNLLGTRLTVHHHKPTLPRKAKKAPSHVRTKNNNLAQSSPSSDRSNLQHPKDFKEVIESPLGIQKFHGRSKKMDKLDGNDNWWPTVVIPKEVETVFKNYYFPKRESDIVVSFGGDCRDMNMGRESVTFLEFVSPPTPDDIEQAQQDGILPVYVADSGNREGCFCTVLEVGDKIEHKTHDGRVSTAIILDFFRGKIGK